MYEYDEEVLQTFLEKQSQLFAENVAENLEEAEAFLEDCMAVVVDSLKEVKEYFNVPVIISKIDAGRLEDEELINERPYVKIPYKAVKADILICEDDIINLDELSFSFLGMPGHTDGSMAIIVNDNIFSGDTIMFEKHGKTSLPCLLYTSPSPRDCS